MNVPQNRLGHPDVVLALREASRLSVDPFPSESVVQHAGSRWGWHGGHRVRGDCIAVYAGLCRCS